MQESGTRWPAHPTQDKAPPLPPDVRPIGGSLSARVEKIRKFRVAGMPLSAIAFLVLIAAIALLRSHFHLLWADEFDVLETDGVASLARVIHIQSTSPVSVDPLVYNALAHGAIDLFGPVPFAIRLPSMCGYLIMGVCLFYFVRRIATERAAIFALALPALLGIVSYSVQARPYGLLLGLSALVMVSWQTVTRRESKRTLALLTLFLSLVLVINTHYYGVLLLIPVCAAEVSRSFERRRLDYPVVFSIAGACLAGALILLPFAKGASKFRAHYYERSVSYHFISHCYIWMVMGYTRLSVATQHILGLAFAFLLAALIWAFIRLRSSIVLALPEAEAVFLCTLSALPVFGFLLARSVTKVVDDRYVLSAIIGITALLAVLAAPLLQKKIVGRAILVGLFLAIAVAGIFQIQAERDQAKKYMGFLQLDPVMKATLEANRPQPIYVMNPTVFQGVSYYSPDHGIRSRLRLTYSGENEMRHQQSNYLSLTVANMRANGVPNVTPFEPLTAHGSEHLFLLYREPWDWTGRAFADAHATVTYLGPAYGGELVLVRFP